MTREERLESCRICTNRKLDWNLGLLCGLTKEMADFENECESFSIDKDEKEYILKRDLAAAGDNTVGDPVDFEKNKKHGALFFWIGLVIVVVSFMAADVAGGGYVIFPFGAVIYGGVQYLRGVEQEKVFKKNSPKDD